ncbi:hypothetical protein Bbelb_049000 [Branchiostoma belcheri]|nr:hypothetical protein Bbelb_049000 [Branchiostoma belcheri]
MTSATPADCEETTTRGSRSRHRLPATEGHSRDRVFILTNQLQDGSDSADVETTSPTHASLPTPAPGRVTGTTSSRSIELVTSPEIDWPTLTLSLVPMFLASLAGPMLVRLAVARPVVIAWEAGRSSCCGRSAGSNSLKDKRERRELRPTGDTRDGEHNIERLICPSFDGTFFFDDPDVLVFPKLLSKFLPVSHRSPLTFASSLIQLSCRSFFRDRRALSTRRLSASLPETSGDDGQTNAYTHESSNHTSDAFVKPDAFIRPDAVIRPDAFVTPDAVIRPDAFVTPDAVIRPDAFVTPDAVIRPDAFVTPDAVIRPDAFVTPDAVIRPDAFVTPDAVIRPDAFVTPDAVIRPDAFVTPDAVIRPDAFVTPDAVIRPDAFVTPDAVIRSDAF